MRKIRIIAKFTALLIIATIGLRPGLVALADTESQDSNLEEKVQVENKESSVAEEVIDIGKVTVTTSSAIVVEKSEAETDDAVIQEPVSIDFNNEYNKASEALRVFKATNATTEEDVINLIKSNVDSSIKISFTDDGSFIKKDATIDMAGAITGTIKISNDTDSKEIKLNLVIDQLKSEVEAVDLNSEVEKGKKALMFYKATNDTKEQDIIDLMKNSIDSSIVVSIKDFNNIPATIDTFGTVTGILTFTLNGDAQELNMYKPIDKLKIQNTDVSSLEVKMNGLEQDNQQLYIGDKVFVQVTVYDADGKQVKLEPSLIQYQWYVDGKAVSDETNSEIKITKDMKGKDVKCTVNYDERGGN